MRGIVGIDGKIVVVVLPKFDFACHRLGWGDIRAHCLLVVGGTHNLRISYRLIELVNKKVAVLQPIQGLTRNILFFNHHVGVEMWFVCYFLEVFMEVFLIGSKF